MQISKATILFKTYPLIIKSTSTTTFNKIKMASQNSKRLLRFSTHLKHLPMH